MVDGERVTREQLTLATAQRQWLAQRVEADAERVAQHLLGLQAQEPFEPYVGVFSRAVDADPADLARALVERRVARTHTMRRTVHLHPRADALALRALHDEMLRQRTGHVLAQVRGPGSERVAVDAGALERATAPLFHAAPHRLRDVGRAVADLFPGAPASSLGDAACSLTPVVQTTPRAVWGMRGRATYTTYRAWWGEDPPSFSPRENLAARSELVLRYLAAYGPAATADVRAFSGATGFPEAVSALGDRLRRYRDERGRTLLDLAERPLLDPALPASAAELPVRFLPAFDNAVLGYDDRSRLIDDEHKPLSVAGARYVLVAGRVAGTWEATGMGGLLEPSPSGRPGRAEVTATPLRRWTRGERARVREEAHALARFLGGRPGRVTLAASP